MSCRLLTDDDAEQAWRLSQLAFGWLGGEVPPTLDGQTVMGVDGPEGLAGMARLRSYEQCWGGRAVPMGGIASVAVHPHGRGRGTARALMACLLGVMRENGQPLSVLFPTAPGIYRRLGWECVGSLDETVVPTAALRQVGDPGGVGLRPARAADGSTIQALYDGQGVDGLLTRAGPEFPAGADAVLEHDVVTLAEAADGRPLGYASYGRGTGYRGSQLTVWELVSAGAEAARALLRSIASWDAVAPTVRWRGPADDLALLLPSALPPPEKVQPWMLRIVDAPAAVAARGFAADADVAFSLVDPDIPAHSRGWRLTVHDSAGRLEPVDDADLPRLHVRGLALLYAGAGSGPAVRAGLMDRPLPQLDRAFGGQRPRLLDYF